MNLICINRRKRDGRMKPGGFTLVELVMVLVLIGIIAAFAAPKLGNIPTTETSSFTDKLRANIRYAQALAMTQSMRYRVYFNTTPSPNPGYAVVTSAGAAAPDPAGGGNLSVSLNTGEYAGITVSTPAGGYVEFNSLGSPTVGGGTVLTVSPGGSTVTITANTGAVN